MVALSAEFPNDNPALHGGAIWICETVTSAPTVIAPAAAPERERELQGDRETGRQGGLESETLEPHCLPVSRSPRGSRLVSPTHEDLEEGIDVHVPLESGFFASGAIDDDDAPPIVEELPPLDDVVEAVGAAPEAPAADDPFAVLVTTLEEVASSSGIPRGLVTRLFAGEVLELDAAAIQALADADLVRDGAPTSTFLAACRGWQALLRGTSEDFDACGGKMLDEWTSELLASLAGSVARAPSLRRELRARGVAAFGLAA